MNNINHTHNFVNRDCTGEDCYATMRSAPSYEELAQIQSFFETHATKGIDEAVRLAEISFPYVDLEDIRSSAEDAIAEFPEEKKCICVGCGNEHHTPL